MTDSLFSELLNADVLYAGDNLSDHRPIAISMIIPVSLVCKTIGGPSMSSTWSDLIPNHVRDIVDHNLRNKDDFRNNRPRTEKYKHTYSWMVSGCFDSFCDKIKPLAKRNELYNGFTREANIAHAP